MLYVTYFFGIHLLPANVNVKLVEEVGKGLSPDKDRSLWSDGQTSPDPWKKWGWARRRPATESF